MWKGITSRAIATRQTGSMAISNSSLVLDEQVGITAVASLSRICGESDAPEDSLSSIQYWTVSNGGTQPEDQHGMAEETWDLSGHSAQEQSTELLGK